MLCCVALCSTVSTSAASWPFLLSCVCESVVLHISSSLAQRLPVHISISICSNGGNNIGLPYTAVLRVYMNLNYYGEHCAIIPLFFFLQMKAIVALVAVAVLLVIIGE